MSQVMVLEVFLYLGKLLESHYLLKTIMQDTYD